MSWSIVEVARHAGISSRTLRHYDALGLVRPAYVGANGYRYYEREQLERLQEVLVLRELGLPLDAVGRLLDGTHDRVAVLREHHRALRAECDRLARLAVTVARTIEEKEGGETTMEPHEMFDGFDAEKQRAYEAEIVERYGADAQEHIVESWRRIGPLGSRGMASVDAEYAAIGARLSPLIDAGVESDDERVLAVIADHYAIVDRFWTPTAEQYAGLGELYVDSPDFRARYDAEHPRMAEYLRDAMAAYAIARLT
jgi:DNA-binding transcriptional MerR regulator